MDHATEGGLEDIKTTPAAILRQRGEALIANPTRAGFDSAVSWRDNHGYKYGTWAEALVYHYTREAREWRENRPDEFEEFDGWFRANGGITQRIVTFGRAMVAAAGEMETN